MRLSTVRSRGNVSFLEKVRKNCRNQKNKSVEDLRPESVINCKIAEALTASFRDLERVDNMWGAFFGSHPIARMLRDSKDVTAELEAPDEGRAA